MDYTTHYASPLGDILLASDGTALIGCWFEGQKYFGSCLSDEVLEEDELEIFTEARRWLDTYFGGHRPDFVPALCLRGTPFRRRVWELLLEIPYGETRTYGQIAALYGAGTDGRASSMYRGTVALADIMKESGPASSVYRGTVDRTRTAASGSEEGRCSSTAAEPEAHDSRGVMSARAVGGAVGHNPISLIIPCHRVTGADGSLTGYAGGTERKRILLEMEGRGNEGINA